MMKNPRISVIMPVYNSERYLAEAIESVLAQSYEDFEIFIIDDGSTDSSLSTSRYFAQRDSRIKILENGENLGIVKTLNVGLEESRGEFIARMDADDICLPERFEKQITFLDEHAQIGVVGTSYSVIDESGAIQNKHHPPSTDTLIRWHLLFHNPFAHPSVMYRSVLGKKVQYSAAHPHCEDYEFWTRFLDLTKGANLEDTLLLYRKTTESVSATNRELQSRGATEISRQQISLHIIADLISIDEVTALRQWYQSNSVALLDGDDLELFEKWRQIFAAFSDQYWQYPEELALIQEKFRSVNTYISTKEQLADNSLLFSVVVCTFNRARHLVRLLESLISQTLSSSQYEVIIVDNKSTDDTAHIVKAFCDKHDHVYYYLEEKQGLAHARNRGMEEASGVYVVYSDDDALLPETWLEKAAEIISDRGYGALGGPYYPFYEHDKPVWFKNEYGSSSWLPSEPCLLQNQYLVGGNMFYRKDLLRAVKGFPVDYGMSGHSLGYGEETYMQIKMKKEFEGLHTYFSPDLYIEHLVNERKLHVLWPLRRYFRQGMDSQRHTDKSVGPQIAQNNRVMTFLRLTKLVLRMAFDFLVKIHFRNKDKFEYWQNYVYQRGQYYGYNFGKQWAKLINSR